jgi:outer membrane protein OmpA-like peptidoglycan-associated protein
MSRLAGDLVSRRTFGLLFGSTIASTLAVPGIPGIAEAQEGTVDVETMVGALRGRRRTRGGPAPSGPAPSSPEIDRFFELRRHRGPNLQEREELQKIISATGRPQIDLTVYFAFNSAWIEPNAAAVLGNLGQALRHPDLRGQRFGIFGHTDAVGSAQYNLELSTRRADSVRQFLIATFSISPDALLAVGYGFERLKNPRNPYADENRRVQVVNLTG